MSGNNCNGTLPSRCGDCPCDSSLKDVGTPPSSFWKPEQVLEQDLYHPKIVFTVPITKAQVVVLPWREYVYSGVFFNKRKTYDGRMLWQSGLCSILATFSS
ncbi:unnamed protein product [Calypogeia fissa]